VQVGQLDSIVVNEAQAAHARSGQVQGRRRAQPAAADNGHACLTEACLSLHAKGWQQQLAAVALDLLLGHAMRRGACGRAAAAGAALLSARGPRGGRLQLQLQRRQLFLKQRDPAAQLRLRCRHSISECPTASARSLPGGATSCVHRRANLSSSQRRSKQEGEARRSCRFALAPHSCLIRFPHQHLDKHTDCVGFMLT
jgi:hypothetical protein